MFCYSSLNRLTEGFAHPNKGHKVSYFSSEIFGFGFTTVKSDLFFCFIIYVFAVKWGSKLPPLAQPTETQLTQLLILKRLVFLH